MPRPKGVTRNKNKKRKLDINHQVKIYYDILLIMICLILMDKETIHEIFKCKINHA